MKTKNILEQITETEADRIVADDLARFHKFAHDPKKCLIFHATGHMYYKTKEYMGQESYYKRIGNMQPKGEQHA